MSSHRRDETPEERRARQLLERELRCSLERIPCGRLPTVDYRCLNPGCVGGVGVEVKRLTNETYNELTSAYRKSCHHDSAALSGRWTVIIDRPTLSESLSPLPSFPDDDEQEIAAMEAFGFIVTRKADRVAEWRATHPGPKLASPQLRDLAADLEPSLVVLEEHGLDCTRGLHPFGQSPALALAIVTIANRTGGAMCQRLELFPGQEPGIEIALGSTYVRTGCADTLVARLDLWLRSERSMNLLESLANEAGGTERHAVLIFDAQTEPEYQSAAELGTDFCPTQPLDLPHEIDVLWFVLGPVAGRYTATEGWTTTLTPDAALNDLPGTGEGTG